MRSLQYYDKAFALNKVRGVLVEMGGRLVLYMPDAAQAEARPVPWVEVLPAYQPTWFADVDC